MQFNTQLMRQIHLSKFLFIICVSLACIPTVTEANHRIKRKVVFTKNSKMFFRLNGKANVIPWVQIFALGWAIRVNYDLPENIQKKHMFFKRDIHADIEDIPNESAKQGFSCVTKYLCETISQIKQSANCGILCEIGRIISRTNGTESDFFHKFLDKCDNDSATKCPFPFITSTSYLAT